MGRGMDKGKMMVLCDRLDEGKGVGCGDEMVGEGGRGVSNLSLVVFVG